MWFVLKIARWNGLYVWTTVISWQLLTTIKFLLDLLAFALMFNMRGVFIRKGGLRGIFYFILPLIKRGILKRMGVYWTKKYGTLAKVLKGGSFTIFQNFPGHVEQKWVKYPQIQWKTLTRLDKWACKPLVPQIFIDISGFNVLVLLPIWVLENSSPFYGLPSLINFARIDHKRLCNSEKLWQL